MNRQKHTFIYQIISNKTNETENKLKNTKLIGVGSNKTSKTNTQ